MSIVLTRVPTGLPGAPVGNEPERVGIGPAGAQAGGRITLEQRLDSVWEVLRAGRAAVCPVCRAEFGPAGGSGAIRCGGCGSVIS